jgi:hypothetical protein
MISANALHKELSMTPLVNEAWDLIEKEIMLSWKHSSDHDIESREHLWLTLKNLNRLKLHFESIVTTGKMNSKI